MVSSEWQELDELSRNISDAQHRAQAAEAVGSLKLARDVHREIAGMEKRQSELLSVIASSVVGPTGEATTTTQEGNLLRLAAPDLEEPSTQLGREESAMWNKLTPADIDRARQELERQRTETLARHAAELKSLEAEGVEVEALEQAIHTFMRKFGGAELVPA